MKLIRKSTILPFVIAALLASPTVCAQATPTSGSVDWEKTLDLARKEGKVVVSIPASPELRATLERNFKQRFGIEIEPVAARGSAGVRRIVDESKAGVRYFDVHLGGSESTVGGLLPEGVLDAVENWFVLPEVKDPKQWWGGHIWTDNAKRFIYTMLAYTSESVWYNAQQMKAEEVRSFDDLLDKKWIGKIGFLDPRTPGAGSSLWSYLREIKGEEFLKRLVTQKMFISRDQRLLAENLAKGKVAMVLALSYYSVASFVKAGLAVHPLPNPKEGTYISGGSGHLVIVKNAAHPNATKIFVNWLLTKEGQDLFGRALGQGTRRLDVDTKWLREVGVVAAKDVFTPAEYSKRENNSEEKIIRVREPAAALARKFLD